MMFLCASCCGERLGQLIGESYCKGADVWGGGESHSLGRGLLGSKTQIQGSWLRGGMAGYPNLLRAPPAVCCASEADVQNGIYFQSSCLQPQMQRSQSLLS